jgi:ubiquinone/menaquinone biosynthesis C-methylase UbiE
MGLLDSWGGIDSTLVYCKRSLQMPKVRRSHFLIGAHGLAVLREWPRGEDAVSSRVAELVRLAKNLDAHPLNALVELYEMDVPSGYGAWAATYDDANNALINVEEPAVHGLLEKIQGGAALDAACGTGRYAMYFRERGFKVAAVDASPAMMSKALQKVPTATFALADLSSLPFASGSFDVAVCALALDHCRDLSAPVDELSRVLKSDGHLVISVFHPANALIGGGAFFSRTDGRRGIVENYWHGVAEYIAAFVGAGLEVESCIERHWTEREVMLMTTAKIAPEACIAAFTGVPLVLVWGLRRS